MKSTFIRLPLLLFFIIFPLLLLYFDGRTAITLEKDKTVEKQKKEVKRLLESVVRSSKNDFQVRKVLDRFLTDASDIASKQSTKQTISMLNDMYNKNFGRNFPPLDIVLAARDLGQNKPRILFSRSANLGFHPEISELFLEGIAIESISANQLESFKQKMSKSIHFPCSKETIRWSNSHGFQQFSSVKGTRGLYFDVSPSVNYCDNPWKYALAAVIDTANLPPNFTLQRIIDDWADDESGIAFFPITGGVPLYSVLLEREPELRQALFNLAQGEYGPDPFFLMSDFTACLGKDVVMGSHIPIVVSRMPRKKIPIPATIVLFNVLSIFTAGFIGAYYFEKKIRKRRPRISVGFILFIVFMIVAIVPLTGINTIARYIIAEKENRNSQISSNILHERLIRFDEEVKCRQAELIQVLRRLALSPSLATDLTDKSGRWKTENVIASLSRNVSKNLSWKKAEKFSALVAIVGKENYFRSWAKSATETLKSKPEEILDVLLPAFKEAYKKFVKLFCETRRKQNPLQFDDEDNMTVKERMKTDVTGEILDRLVGARTYAFLRYFPQKLTDVRMNLGKLSCVSTPVFHKGFPQFLITWMWEESVVRDGYINMFDEKANDSDDSKFYITLAREQSSRHHPGDLELNKDLHSLVLRARELRKSLADQVETASGPAVVEVLPSANLVNCFFSGIVNIVDTSIETSNLLWRTVFFALLLAATLAICSTMFFMAPLRRILGVIRRLRPGKYDERSDDSHRADEFGTLAQAFNSMLKGLQEKEVLGRYVSGSVKRMLSDSEFLKSAQEGYDRDVTIVFSGFHEFENFQETHSHEEVFKLINEQLSALNAAVEKYGGEISKVIGEKVLTVFDHTELGNGKNAVKAALNVVREMKQRLSGIPISPVFGLNSGSVIAGIIGSATARLDYTVIGDTVNLASRLATLAHITGGSRIVLSGTTFSLSEGEIRAEKLPFKRVKGKTKEVEAFLLLEN